jgi:hypothetical protein
VLGVAAKLDPLSWGFRISLSATSTRRLPANYQPQQSKCCLYGTAFRFADLKQAHKSGAGSRKRRAPDLAGAARARGCCALPERHPDHDRQLAGIRQSFLRQHQQAQSGKRPFQERPQPALKGCPDSDVFTPTLLSFPTQNAGHAPASVGRGGHRLLLPSFCCQSDRDGIMLWSSCSTLLRTRRFSSP